MRWLAAMGWVVIGCAPVPPTTVAEIDFPPGFAMDTHRRVDVVVQAAPDVDTRSVFLSIRSPGGMPLFEGPASHAVAYGVPIRLAATVGAVEVAARSADGTELTEILSIPADGRVVYTVGGGR